VRAIGLVLLVLGILAVAYGGFWTTRNEEKARLGPVKVEVEERERVNIPLWAGVAGIVAGAVLVATGGRKPA
jgi:hypothetical protein